MTTTIPRTFEDAEAVLAKALPGYESRPQQQELARSIERCLTTRTHLVAEAGCGTGKSLGYLIPAILSGKRVVVTTATKALQDQIGGKDLPFLEEHLPVPFKWTVLKGRSSYVCQAKLVDEAPESRVAVFVRSEDSNGYDGTREELPFEVDDRDWRSITTGSDECPGKTQCPFGETCYAEAAKTKAKESNVVVINHALFFTDLKVRQDTGGLISMLDAYDVVIADEAHELEEWASKMLGAKVTELSIQQLLGDVRNFVMDNFDTEIDPAAVNSLAACDVAGAALVDLWGSLRRWFDQKNGKGRRIHENGRLRAADVLAEEDRWVELCNALTDLADAVSCLHADNAVLGGGADMGKLRTRLRRIMQRCLSTEANVTDLAAAPWDLMVRWITEEEWGPAHRRQSRLVVNSSPIEVGDILRGMLWSKTPGILVSATMATGGTFNYITGRLGISDFVGIDVGTPFDYTTQAQLYVPRHMPIPSGKTRGEWENMSVTEIRDLLRFSDGRALVLFTSSKQMREVHAQIKGLVPWTVMIQGEAPNPKLAERFMADEHSVLFATRSFFTGVDFQGDACSLVIIDKLPFPVPTEPVTEARCELIEKRGGRAFDDYTIPVMSLILKQGFGRLIRHRNDTGVVAILDARLDTKGYGRKIVESLPPAPLVTRQADVASFFEGAA
jgi:ATP-dependent DNA helicase DinG